MRILRRLTVAINLGIGVASAILGASAPAAAQCRLIQLAEIRVGREQNNTFDTLMIGEETIRNAKIRISDLFGGDQAGQTTSPGFGFFEGLPDMLIGDDFFQSHRVLLMPRERKVLFTYNGGQVFQLLRPDEAFPAPDGDRR
jgi:hypothetical protein